MRVLIIGAGAVGSFVGARLALAGHDVTLVGRLGLVAAVRSGGLTLIEPSGSRHAANVSAAGSIAEAFAGTSSTPEPIRTISGGGFRSTADGHETPPCCSSDRCLASTSASLYDLALVTVKAYDTACVIAELQATGAGQLPPLLTLQNGVGNEEALAAVFGAQQVVSGAIDTPVSVPTAGLVQVHRPRFKAGVAPVGSQAPSGLAATLLRGAGLATDVFGDYRRLKWSKLLMNVLANAQCAVLDWTPTEVMADPVSARLEARAWQEAFRIMAAHGIRPVALAGYPLPLLAAIVRSVSPDLLARLVRRFVAGGRGSKRPSLHVALSTGKRSEVRWLNGAVAEYAARLGRQAPVNRALTDILSALAEGQESWDAWRGQPGKLAERTDLSPFEI